MSSEGFLVGFLQTKSQLNCHPDCRTDSPAAGQHLWLAGGHRREPRAGAAPAVGVPALDLLRRDAGADDGPRAPLPLGAGRRAGQRGQEQQPHLPGHHHL